MTELLSTTGIALVVFATTNIDDMLILAAFFADPKLGPRAVILGQLLGMAVLTLASALAALLALTVPEGVIGLLGVVPLGIGLRQLWSLWRARGASGDEDDGSRAQEDRLQAATRSHVLAIAGVTIANGGDNLGVYIPLFARDPSWIGLYALVFAVMTVLWCGLGHWLVHHSLLGARIRRFGHVALPFVLVALGLYILADALVLLRSP